MSAPTARTPRTVVVMEVRSLLTTAAVLAAVALVAYMLGSPEYARWMLGGATALVGVVITDLLSGAR